MTERRLRVGELAADVDQASVAGARLDLDLAGDDAAAERQSFQRGSESESAVGSPRSRGAGRSIGIAGAMLPPPATLPVAGALGDGYGEWSPQCNSA